VAALGNGAAGRYAAASFVLHEKGYVVSGYDGEALNNYETWMYDDVTAAWYKKADFTHLEPNLLTPYPDDSILVYLSRRWSTGFSSGDDGYIYGGYTYGHDFMNDLWRYSASLDKWFHADTLYTPTRAAASGFVIGLQAYVGTGYNGVYLDDFYSYSFGADEWRPVAQFEGNNIDEGVGFSINGKGYICAGRTVDANTNELWEYTPDTLAGMAEDETAGDFIIYPNPAQSFFHIECKMQNTELVVYDRMGKMVQEQMLYSQRSTIHCDLPGGIYFVEARSTKKVYRQKLVIE
jgi:hypothetical protein